jgi:hypothetical protein
MKAGEVAGALTALVTAAVLLWTTVLKPASSPPVFRASVSHIEVHPGRTLRIYLNSHPAPLQHFLAGARAQGLAREEIDQVLRTRGVVVDFTVGTEGATRRPVTVTHTMYDARTEARVPEGAVSVVPPEHYLARADTYQTTQSTWIQAPRRRGAYFVEIEVTEPNAATLANGRSPVFHLP